MAGMLPGVDHRRRMSQYCYRHEKSASSTRFKISVSERFQTPAVAVDVSTMDETAVRALRRLEQKLGYPCSSSRSRELQQDNSGGGHKKLQKKCPSSVGRPWLFQFSKCKTLKKFCSV